MKAHRSYLTLNVQTESIIHSRAKDIGLPIVYIAKWFATKVWDERNNYLYEGGEIKVAKNHFQCLDSYPSNEIVVNRILHNQI